MANLSGNPTSFGEKLYLDNLLAHIQFFVLIGSDTLENAELSAKLEGLDLFYSDVAKDILTELPISHAGYDENNQAYFSCLVPYDLNLEKYIFAIALIYDDNGVKRLADWGVVNKLYQTKQVGGTYKYLVAVTGEAGGVIFKSNDYITTTEFDMKSQDFLKKTESAINSQKLEGKTLEQVKAEAVGAVSAPSWNSVTEKPSTFPASSHTHPYLGSTARAVDSSKLEGKTLEQVKSTIITYKYFEGI